MNTLKQSLCRLMRSSLRSLLRAMLVVGLLLSVLSPAVKAQVVRQPASAPVVAGPAAAPETSPEQQLSQAVQQWVAGQRSVRPEQVQLTPLDARLRVQGCARPLAMDLPMASADTVRVRCSEPAWQLFVRVQGIQPLEGGAAAPPAQAAMDREIRRTVVVAAKALVRGTTVQADEVRLQETVLPPSAAGYFDQLAETMHSEVLRDIPAGSPVRRSDLRPLVLVKRGQLIQLQIGKNTGFVVSARVEAMQDGRLGEQIKLKSNESGRVLSGIVRGPGMVEGN